MKNSKIEWCDHTFNPWEGCTKVSPGCANCYAENRNARFGGGTAPNWGKGAPRRRTSEANWNQPLKWDRDHADLVRCANLAGEHPPRRPRVFCASLADWLDDEVPIDWLADLLDLIRRTPNLDWLLLTKRPENWMKRVEEAFSFAAFSPAHHAMMPWVSRWHPSYGSGGGVKGSPVPPANIWIGTTVEDQWRANVRIPHLLRIPARVRFLSCEPLLGPVDLTQWLHPDGRCEECGSLIVSHRSSISCNCCSEGPEPTLDRDDLIHWLICGGESGPGARPMHPGWARWLRDQCEAACVPFLFKQWGEWAPYNCGRDDVTKLLNPAALDTPLIHVGKVQAGRLLDGVEHNEFPEVKS